MIYCFIREASVPVYMLVARYRCSLLPWQWKLSKTTTWRSTYNAYWRGLGVEYWPRRSDLVRDRQRSGSVSLLRSQSQPLGPRNNPGLQQTIKYVNTKGDIMFDISSGIIFKIILLIISDIFYDIITGMIYNYMLRTIWERYAIWTIKTEILYV